MLWENLTSLVVAVNVLFGHPEAPLMDGILAIAVLGGFMIGGPILYWIWRPDTASQLANELSYNYVGEHVSGEDEDDPAMADTMPSWTPQPKLHRRPRVQTRVTPLPRYHFFGTVRRGNQQMAIHTTGRGKRSESVIIKVAKYGHYLVEKRGNRMWVTE